MKPRIQRQHHFVDLTKNNFCNYWNWMFSFRSGEWGWWKTSGRRRMRGAKWVLFLGLFQYYKKLLFLLLRWGSPPSRPTERLPTPSLRGTSSALFLFKSRDNLPLDQQGDVVIVMWAPCCLSIRGESPRIWRRAHFHSCLCISEDRLRVQFVRL
jgi:hypothetical protein